MSEECDRDLHHVLPRSSLWPWPQNVCGHWFALLKAGTLLPATGQGAAPVAIASLAWAVAHLWHLALLSIIASLIATGVAVAWIIATRDIILIAIKAAILVVVLLLLMLLLLLWLRVVSLVILVVVALVVASILKVVLVLIPAGTVKPVVSYAHPAELLQKAVC